MAGHILEELKHIFLLYKRHLTVDLGELWLTISTQVLITEALGNLEVTIETADHQQLLEGLRRLGQCIELARIHTAGNHEVASTLRRRAKCDGAVLGSYERHYDEGRDNDTSYGYRRHHRYCPQ